MTLRDFLNRFTSKSLAAFVLGAAFIVTAQYYFGNEDLSALAHRPHLSQHATPMALSTAILFIITSIAIMLRK